MGKHYQVYKGDEYQGTTDGETPLSAMKKFLGIPDERDQFGPLNDDPHQFVVDNEPYRLVEVEYQDPKEP